MRLAVLIACLISSAALAGEYPFLKQTNPNSLGLFVSVDPECPFTEEQVESDVKGEFLRARIRATKDLSLNLSVLVFCLVGNELNPVAMYAGVHFGTGVNSLFEIPNNSTIAMGGKDQSGTDYLRSRVKASVGDALTDYLEENFGQ